MERFVEHAQKVRAAVDESKSPDPGRKRHQRIDTGLRRNSEMESPSHYKLSLSPSRTAKRERGFKVKPSQINHFTGKALSPEREVKLEVNRD